MAEHLKWVAFVVVVAVVVLLGDDAYRVEGDQDVADVAHQRVVVDAVDVNGVPSFVVVAVLVVDSHALVPVVDVVQSDAVAIGA